MMMDEIFRVQMPWQYLSGNARSPLECGWIRRRPRVRCLYSKDRRTASSARYTEPFTASADDYPLDDAGRTGCSNCEAPTANWGGRTDRSRIPASSQDDGTIPIGLEVRTRPMKQVNLRTISYLAGRASWGNERPRSKDVLRSRRIRRSNLCQLDRDTTAKTHDEDDEDLRQSLRSELGRGRAR